MSDKTNDDKLGSQPVLEKDTKTSPLKFTDYSVQKFTSNFLDKNNKTRAKVFTSFGFKSGSLKGLGLFQWFSTKAKFFTRRIHLKTTGTDFYWYVGNSATMSCKECEEIITKTYKTHTDDKGHWIKDPRKTKADQDRVIIKKQIEEDAKLTINEVIERIHEAEFPRAKMPGRLDHKSAKVHSRFLIGYNKRYQHLDFVNDLKGNGKIVFTANYDRRVAKPDSWKDLFGKYPPGTGNIKTFTEKSIYDQDLGKTFIADLTEQDVVDYINKKPRSYGFKVNMKKAVAVLWNYAREERLLGPTPKNPTLFSIKKTEEESAFKGSIYNNKRFTNDELSQIWGVMYDDRNNYPFQTECTMLCQATGLRPETAKQIRRSMVKVSEGIIHLPKAILKGKKKDMEIIITQPVQVILDLVEEQRKKNAKYEFIPWLFPTTRVSSKKTGDNYYANSHHTRLSTLKGCWENVRRKLPDLVGSAKTLRKSFISISKLELGTNAKVKVLSGHTQDSTIDTYYDKHTREEAIESANKVSKVYSFIKKAK